MSKQTQFFATRSDLLPIIEKAEGIFQLKYMLCGHFAKPPTKYLNSLMEVPDLGIASNGNCNQEKCYLIVERSAEIHIRSVLTRRDGIHYTVDQGENLHAIVFQPGGVFNESCLIGGYIGTVSKEPSSDELFRVFKREMTKRFERVKSFLVGPEAATMLDSNARLTKSVRSPVEYDLKR